MSRTLSGASVTGPTCSRERRACRRSLRAAARALRLPAALGGVQERAELQQLRGRERTAGLLAVLRHHVVAELRRIGDVFREERDALAARTDRGEVGCAEVAVAVAEVGVAVRAGALGEEPCSGERGLVVGEALLLGPNRHLEDELGPE